MSTDYPAISKGNDSHHGAACVVDLDNILHRGFDRRTGLARPQAIFDAAGFSKELRARGVDRGTICRNWKFSELSERFWGGLGFSVRASRSNCDSRVIDEAKRYSANGCHTLVLVSGDSDYCELVDHLRASGIFVEIWARRSNASRQLIRMADRVQHIDNLLLPASADWARAAHKDGALPGENLLTARIPSRDEDEVQRLRAPQLGIHRDRKISIGWPTRVAILAA